MLCYTVSRSLKTRHYCILWLQSSFVIYVVLNLYYMMYSNIVKEIVFTYIEHGILRYGFAYDITMYLFQVLPLLHWTSEFSKIMIIMYFGHYFPLTSHIRGASVINPNGTSPSKWRHSLCWYTKGQIRIKFSKTL